MADNHRGYYIGVTGGPTDTVTITLLAAVLTAGYYTAGSGVLLTADHYLIVVSATTRPPKGRYILQWFAAVVLEPQGHCNSNHYLGLQCWLSSSVCLSGICRFPRTTLVQQLSV